MKKTITFLVLFIFVFLVSFYYFLDQATANATLFLQKKLSLSFNKNEETIANEPKTEECILSGALYGKSQKAAWDKRRPLGIMVENSVDARPQSGLSHADVVFEAVAEGGITRFLAVYYCQGQEVIGPVRSARVYYIDFIGGFGKDPLYAHVGGANTPGPANALGQLEEEGWAGYNDLNQFSIGFPVFWRDYERLTGVATEHTMYTNTEKLWETAAKRGLTDKNKKSVSWTKGYTEWRFKEDASMEQRPNKQTIQFGFWDINKNITNSFRVRWVYNKNSNQYNRYYGDKPHLDLNTGKPLEAKNVVVLFMDESAANDGYEKGQHLLYETTGEGKALVFQDGKAIKASWEKEDRYTQIKLADEQGNEIKFVKGPIWFAVLPTGNKVSY